MPGYAGDKDQVLARLRRIEGQVRGLQRLVDEDAVRDAMTTPPTDTRAYFRGRCLEKYSGDVAAASWDSVIFDVPERPALQRLPLLDPLRGTREQVGQLIDECNSVTELFAALGR